MALRPYATWMLEQEARALLARLNRLKPFGLLQPMVPAAALQPGAQTAIEQHLMQARATLTRQVAQFLDWLQSHASVAADAAEGQRRYTFLRLRFDALLTQFDLFSEVITQRGESENGVWLAGLDTVCAEAISLPGDIYQSPPIVCYLDRGPGGAIRRAYTRLPGGGSNPVAIVRIPRERMIGSGVASSLVHEVGHQAAALLDLAQSLGGQLRRLQNPVPGQLDPWHWWETWISEIAADFWAVARVGAASTLGLIGLLSLPKPIVMRLSGRDPHPVPWLRVKLSCAIGAFLYPDPQWERLARLWQDYYPLTGLAPRHQQFLRSMERSIPEFVRVLVQHRPSALRGRSLPEMFQVESRQPARLREWQRHWASNPKAIYEAPPSLVFAVFGQARVNGMISPEQESDALAKLLTHWALRNATNTSARCAYHVSKHASKHERNYAMAA